MRKFFFIVLSVLLVGGAQAQSARVLADKIIGILGDKIVLKSDIANYIDDIKRKGGDVPADAECILLERMMMDKALVLQAEKDSLPISDDEINAELDQRVRYFIMEYGGKEAVEQIAGRTIYQIKEDSRQSVREKRLADAMRSKIVDNIKITPFEVKTYFDKIPKDSLIFYETELVIGQVVMYPKAGRELEKYAIDELNDYRKQIEAGKSFDNLVRLYSEDPGKAQNGGRYEMNKADKQWDPEFKNAAFRLKEGQVSPVIRSKFGYHIIQLISRNGDDIVVKHILRVPQITEIEITETREKLDSVRSKLIAGTIKFGEAVDRYSEDEGAKMTAGLVMGQTGSTTVTIDELDKDIVKDLGTLKVSEYSKPLEFTNERGIKALRIIVIQSKTEPHRENLRDDYNKIAQRATEEKKMAAVEKWFRQKLPTYYVMVDPEYGNCASMKETFPALVQKTAGQ